MDQLNTTTHTNNIPVPLTLEALEKAMKLLPSESLVSNFAPKRDKGLFERLMNKIGYNKDSEFIMINMNAFRGISIYKWPRNIEIKK